MVHATRFFLFSASTAQDDRVGAENENANYEFTPHGV